MYKFAEVHQSTPAGGFIFRTQLAALAVTSEPDGGAETMTQLKIAYPGAEYRWHYCNHDEGGGCRTEVA